MLQLQQKRPLYKQLHQTSKKLVLVLATSTSITEANKKDVFVLDWVSCICYLIPFKKNKIWALINSDNKVNNITLGYTLKLGLKIRLTNVRAQKINGSTLEMFEIVLTSFQIENTLGKTRFF